MFTYDDAVAILMHYASKLPVKPNTQDPQRPARARALLGAMGDPHLKYPVIHITGTKGKGSVCAMSAAILRAQGLRVGMYTSPNLQDIRERFNINGVMVDKETLTGAVQHLAPIFERIEGTRYPEVMATLALYLFAQHHVDVALVEVSVGGRLDATNAVYPAVSVITSISFDHVQLLGKTLKDIAWEKGGIIKAGCPAVSAPQTDEAAAELERIAVERSAPFTLVGRDVPFEVGASTLSGQSVTLGEDEHKQTYTTALLGAHQAVNTAVAITALRQLKVIGIEISEQAIHDGLRGVFWAGRMEIVGHDPLVLLDSAHNPESAVKLREAVEILFPQHPRILVYGSKATKDIGGTIKELLPLADHLVLTRSSDGMTDDPIHLANIVRDLGYNGTVVVESNLNAALDNARTAASSTGMICITGSMFIVGETRTLLGLVPQ
jgi:dihydrofolate synthase / folylpolyglutamate synthase